MNQENRTKYIFFYKDEQGATQKDLITIQITGQEAEIYYWYRETPEFKFGVKGQHFVAKLKEAIAVFKKLATKHYTKRMALHDFIEAAELVKNPISP